MEAVASAVKVLLPVREVLFLGGRWSAGELVQFLQEFGFKFNGLVSELSLQNTTLPDGWTTEGEAWTPGKIVSRRWWILDHLGRRRIEVRMKLPWGWSSECHFMILEPSSPEADDPRLGW